MTKKNYKPIKGSGGGKSGGGASFREDENTLQTSQTIRQLYAIGAGPIGGLVNGAKSIYVNGVAVQNSDGKYNFGGKVVWDERRGLPSQAYMEGFPSANAEFGVGVEVTTATPRVQTTSSPHVDAMRVTVGLPNGLYEQLTDEARLTGAVVTLALDKKLTSSGTWVQDREFTINGKTMSAYAQSYTVRRPAGTGTFDVRLRRITEDSTSAALVNKTMWNSYTEVEYAKLEYENIAVVGVAVNAKDLSTQTEPTIAFEVFGTLCRIPSNYNPVTRVYSGVWDGTFKMAWTDNPAWCLYDLLTDPENGMGYRITDDRVDKYAFYSAGVYADGNVDNGAGGTEPRFRCNVPIERREQGVRLANYLAGCMRAKVVWGGGKVSLIQDRPGSSVRQIGTADVVDGLFTYTSSTLPEQHTAARVTWFNPEEDYLQDIEVVDAASETGAWKTFLQGWQNEQGYNEIEHTAYACTSRGQARREGRWLLHSLLMQNEFVKFQMSFNGMSLQVNDVIEIFDGHRSGLSNAGRTAEGSTTTVIKLDRPATLTANSTIQLVMPTGVVDRAIIETSGTAETITLASALSAAPDAGTSYGITTAVEPKPYRITKIGLEGKNLANIEAIFYDAGKYDFVEDGIAIPAPTFTARPPRVTTAPRNLTFNERASVVDDVVQRSLHVGWDAPLTGNVVSYTVQYRIAGGAWKAENTPTNALEVDGIVPGSFECRVAAISHLGLAGPELRGTYTVSNTTATGSSLDAVTNLQEANTNSTSAFTGRDVYVKWTNPATNGNKTAALKDFQVQVLDPATDAVVRTVYVAKVPAGSVQRFRYSYSMNSEDTDDTPRRSVKFSIRCRDGNNKLSAATAITLTNAAPPALNNFTATGVIEAVLVQWAEPTARDYEGVIVWASTNSAFTPSAANKVWEGKTNLASIQSLALGSTWYFKAAAYDSFGKSDTGDGLNLTGSVSASIGKVGIQSVSALPPTGTEGQLVYLATDGKLYRYHGGTWTAAVPAVDVTGQLTDAQLASIAAAKVAGQLTDSQLATISAAKVTGQLVASQIADASLTTAKFASGLRPVEVVAALPGIPHTEGRMVYLTTDDKLYRNTGSGWVSSVAAADITGTVSDAQIAGLAASKVTGQLTNSQLADLAASKLTGQITTTQITDSAVSTAKLAAGAVTASKISAGTITANEIAAGTITSTNLATGSVTAAAIAAGAVNTSELAAGAVTTAALDALAVTSDKLAANSVVAGKIQAGAIGATEIAANAITVKQLAVTDFTNLVPNGTVATGDATGFTTVQTDGATSNTLPSGWDVVPNTQAGSVAYTNCPTAYMLRAAATVTENTGPYCSPHRIVVTPGEKLYVSAMASITGGTANYVASTARWIIYFFASDGSSAGTSSSYWPTLGTGWSKNEAVVTVPAAAVSCKMRLFNNAASGSSGSLLFTNLFVKRMASAELIVDGAITASKIAAGAITANEIAAGTITSANLATGSVTATAIAAGSVSTSELAAGAVTTAKIATNAVTATQIAAGTITANELATNSVTSDKILANSVIAGKIAASAVDATSIATGAVTTAKLAANAVTATTIAADAVTSAKIAVGAVDATAIASNAVTAAKIAANAVTAEKIAAGTITAASGIIADLAVTTLKIAAGAISTTYSASSTGTTASVNISVPADARSVSVLASYGATVQAVTGDKGAVTYTRSVANGALTVNGTVVSSSDRGTSIYTSLNPTMTGTITVSATRSGAGSSGYAGRVGVLVFVTLR